MLVSVMSPSQGEVGPTGAETTLANMMTQQFYDYQDRWLPITQHLNSVITSMGTSGSPQAAEAEGKGTADVAERFAQTDAARTASDANHGIDPGSARFNMGVTGSAQSEALAKGAAVEQGNQAIKRAYLANLGSVTQQGERLANTAVTGEGAAAQVASREAISGAQVANASTAGTMSAIGTGVGAIGQSFLGSGPNFTNTGTIDANAAVAEANMQNGINTNLTNFGSSLNSNLPTGIPQFNMGQ